MINHWFNKLALIIASIGAINWGLVAILDFNAVTFLVGGLAPIFTTILYGVIGVIGAWALVISLLEIFS